MVAIPEAVDSDFWRADGERGDTAHAHDRPLVALRFPVLADVLAQERFVLLSIFKWEHRKGWCACACFLRALLRALRCVRPTLPARVP